MNSFFVNRRAEKVFKTCFFIALFCVAAFFYIPVKDAIIGIPYVAEVRPVNFKENGFAAKIEVPCNRLYEREIGFRIDPPIKIESIGKAQSAVSGTVRLTVNQDNNTIDELIDISRSGWNATSNGVWSKVILLYPPMGSFFCNSQIIELEANNVSFDLKLHAVTIYVSRDRRP